MLEDNVEDENLVVGEGKIKLAFETIEKKKRFLEIMKGVAERSDRIKAEGYRCGNCAAYPCFRMREDSEPVGLCFQATRRCRQECNMYSYKGSPADGGLCKVDGEKTKYNQDCHIPKMRSRISK